MLFPRKPRGPRSSRVSWLFGKMIAKLASPTAGWPLGARSAHGRVDYSLGLGLLKKS